MALSPSLSLGLAVQAKHKDHLAHEKRGAFNLQDTAGEQFLMMPNFQISYCRRPVVIVKKPNTS